MVSKALCKTNLGYSSCIRTLLPCHVLDFLELTLFTHFEACVTPFEGTSTLEVAWRFHLEHVGLLEPSLTWGRPRQELRGTIPPWRHHTLLVGAIFEELSTFEGYFIDYWAFSHWRLMRPHWKDPRRVALHFWGRFFHLANFTHDLWSWYGGATPSWRVSLMI